MKINIIVVIFNEKINQSPLYEIRRKIPKEFVLHYCDNSTNKYIKEYNMSSSIDPYLKYYDMEGNKGISVAYNTILDLCGINEWILLLDQDTLVDLSFFKDVVNEIKRFPIANLHVPIVYSKNKQISPAEQKGHKIITIKDRYSMKKKKLTAINTGMVIKRSVYKQIGYYDEKYFLDYVDHNFMRKYTSFFGNPNILDISLVQNFSGHNFSNFKSDLSRFEIFISDFNEYCKDSISGKIYFYFKIFIRGIKLTIHYKKIDFLKKVFWRK